MLGLVLDDIEEGLTPIESVYTVQLHARMMSLFSEVYYTAGDLGEGGESWPVFSGRRVSCILPHGILVCVCVCVCVCAHMCVCVR